MASIERNSKSKKDGFHESLLVGVLLKVSIKEQSYEIMFSPFCPIDHLSDLNRSQKSI